MRSRTLLVVSALVVCARAATIVAPAAPALQQKLTEAVEQVLQEVKPLDNVHSEQELIEQVNEVKDIDNNLRKVPHNVDAIPVKIVTEAVQPPASLDDVEMDGEPEIKRVKADISNTGEPQRQEHDSQSPQDANQEQQSVATIKQTIVDTQNVINQGFQGVSSGFQSWFTNNEQLSTIQQSIQNLQINFQNQLTKLNNTIQGFWNPDEASSSNSSPESILPETSTGTKQGIMANVEKGLELIENKFEYGVKSMVNGVQVLAAVKAENESGTITNNPLQGFSQYITQFQNSISESFANLQATFQQYVNQTQQNLNINNSTNGPSGFFQNIGAGIQNIIGQQNIAGGASPPSGVQSDDAVSTTSRPTIWQGIQSSIQNIWNRPGQSGIPNQSGGQTNQNAVGSGPIAQAIQNNPLVQGVVNLIQRPTEKPVCVDCDASAEGSNSVPATNEKPEENKPQEDQPQKEKPEAPAAAVGPLQQIVQRNPIMQGLAGAVHKIQTTIANPEKPREDTKGYGGYGGHGGSHSPAQGDNNNGDGVVGAKSEPMKTAAPAAAAPAVLDLDNNKAEQSVPDKTES